MRYDAGSRARTASPQDLRSEITSLEAKLKQTDQTVVEWRQKASWDPGMWYPKLKQLEQQRDLDARRLHDLKYELKCTRSVNDAGNDGWRPASSTYFHGDNG
jgi:hypothetical protein